MEVVFKLLFAVVEITSDYDISIGVFFFVGINHSEEFRQKVFFFLFVVLLPNVNWYKAYCVFEGFVLDGDSNYVCVWVE